jgi:hypothetical protein
MNKNLSKISMLVGVLVGGFALSAFAAWTAAPSTPPNGNVDAPINAGSSAQAKSGNLSVGKSTTPLTGLTLDINGVIGSVGLVATNNITLGSVSSPATFQYVDSHQAVGKVLTSDANGNASWQTGASSGGPVFLSTPNVVFYNTSAITSSIPWYTTSALSAGVPSGAKAIIVEAEATLSGPNGTVTIDSSNPENGDLSSKILLRKDSSSPALLLLSVAAAGGGDFPAWSNQGVFPLASDGSFQWKVKASTPTALSSGDGFFTRIRIIGYYP